MTQSAENSDRRRFLSTDAQVPEIGATSLQMGCHPVEPKFEARYIAELKLAELKSEAVVVVLAATLERGPAGAYIAPTGCD